ncbi:MAG TPA: nucleotidyltransferase family protein [Verrucomicrobiae bacterium]|nr:nucleotidyltransferase family protein [Verrucomicrobiae bacterium]
MDSAPKHPTFLPDASQKLLLEAALWDGEAGLEAWRHWRGNNRIETCDQGSQRLAPLLYHNLRRNGWNGPEMAVLKGTFRKTWVHNERLAQMVAPLFWAWHDLGTSVALLKGAALALKYYPHKGARPMDDLDVLVPIGHINAAMAAFHQGKWTSAKGHPVPKAFDTGHLQRKRTQRLANQNGLELELHWYLLEQGRWAGADEAVWRHAQPILIRDAPALVPGPEHLLTHVLVHGAEWNAVPPIRWVADALMILRSAGGSFDWGLLLEEMRARRIALPIRACLSFLHGAMGADIPGPVIEALEAEKPSPAERLEFRMMDLPKAERSPWRMLWLRHLRLKGLTASRSWIARLATLPDSLRLFWRLDSHWKVPLAAAAFLFGPSAGAHFLLILRRKKQRKDRPAP